MYAQAGLYSSTRFSQFAGKPAFGLTKLLSMLSFGYTDHKLNICLGEFFGARFIQIRVRLSVQASSSSLMKLWSTGFFALSTVIWNFERKIKNEERKKFHIVVRSMYLVNIFMLIYHGKR